MTEVKTTESFNIGKRVKNVSFQSESPSVKIKQRIVNALSKDGGKYVKFDDEVYGILVAAVENNKEFYFAVLNKDRNIVLVKNDNKYSLLREIPANCSVLDYLWNHDRTGLLENATEYFANITGELLTPIYIFIPTKKNVNNKKNTSNKKFTNNKNNKKPTNRNNRH